MSANNIPIKAHVLRERIQQLGLKQAFMAAEIGVTTKTIRRWLSGQVKSLKREHYQDLVRTLELGDSPVLISEADQPLGSKREQKMAASAICDFDFAHLFYRSKEYALMESLVKAVLEPDLNQESQATLFLILVEASFHQSHYKNMGRYLHRAQHAARASESDHLLGKVLMWQGLNLMNQGKPQEAQKKLDEAKEWANNHGLSFGLEIDLHLAKCLGILGKPQQALDYFYKIISLAQKDRDLETRVEAYFHAFSSLIEVAESAQTSRWLDDAFALITKQSLTIDMARFRVLEGYLKVTRGNYEAGFISIRSGLDGIHDKDIDSKEVLYLYAAQAFRLGGRLDLATETLILGFKELPVAKAFQYGQFHLEYSEILKQLNDSHRSLSHKKQAIRLFTKVGADARADAIKNGVPLNPYLRTSNGCED